MLRKIALIATASAVLLMSSVAASAADGVLACVARHMAEPDGNIAVNGTFQLSNLNDNMTLDIDSVRVFTVDGTLVCEGPAGWGIPNALGPNQGMWFNVPRIGEWCGEDKVPADIGWVIVKVYWSSRGRGRTHAVFPLYGRTTEILRDSGKVVGRSILKCESAQHFLDDEGERLPDR
jgi:hypothetical protein